MILHYFTGHTSIHRMRDVPLPRLIPWRLVVVWSIKGAILIWMFFLPCKANQSKITPNKIFVNCIGSYLFVFSVCGNILSMRYFDWDQPHGYGAVQPIQCGDLLYGKKTCSESQVRHVRYSKHPMRYYYSCIRQTQTSSRFRQPSSTYTQLAQIYTTGYCRKGGYWRSSSTGWERRNSSAMV